MTSTLLAVLIVASLLTSILSGMIGMGGGVVLLAVMTVFLPLKLIIPIHGVVQLVSNISRASLLPSFINTKLLAWFALGLPFGAYPAIVILQTVESESPFLLVIVVLILAITRSICVFSPTGLIYPLFK